MFARANAAQNFFKEPKKGPPCTDVEAFKLNSVK